MSGKETWSEIQCKGCDMTLQVMGYDSDGYWTEICECPVCGKMNTNWTSKRIMNLSTSELVAKCRKLMARRPGKEAWASEWIQWLANRPDEDPDLLWSECLNRLEALRIENMALKIPRSLDEVVDELGALLPAYIESDASVIDKLIIPTMLELIAKELRESLAKEKYGRDD